jgi:polyisoprenoid-binding protein YceI
MAFGSVGGETAPGASGNVRNRGRPCQVIASAGPDNYVKEISQMSRIIALILLGLTIGVGTRATAEPREYAFDMAHSRIFFDINHRGYSTMQGRFSSFGGKFLFDAENPTASSLDVTIDPASIDMFHEGLNNHLKNPDFFDVEQFPELRFVSERVEVAGENRFTVHGQFTMLGQTHPLAFNVVLNQTGQGRNGAPMAGLTANGTIDRTKYGMGYGVPMLGTEVAFRVEVEASASGS